MKVIQNFGIAVLAIMMVLLLPKCAKALSLEAAYGEPTCSESMKFTLVSDGTEQSLYAMSGVSRWYEDKSEWVLVVDPSMGGYKTAYTEKKEYEFQFRTSGRYWLKFSVMDKGVSPIATKSINVFMTIDEKAYPTAEALADSIAAQCVNAGCSTDFEKALWLHDWLVRNSDYDYSYSFCSADAALTGNKGTCESYHRAYEMLLDRVGVSNARVVGNGHVWTNVRIDGEWTQVDVTWDDQGDTFNGTFWEHLYFGLTDELMTTAHDEHVIDESRRCDKLDNNYFIRTGAHSTWTDELIGKLEKQTGNTREASLSGYFAPSTADIVYPIVAEAIIGKKISAMSVTDAEAIITRNEDSSISAIVRVSLGAIEAAGYVSGAVQRIEDRAFENTAFTSFALGDGVQSIGKRAFAGSGLKWIRIPSSVTGIEDDAFEGIEGLTVYCEKDSCAHIYAVKKGFQVSLTEN